MSRPTKKVITKMFNLPMDLEEEVLSRVPVRYMRNVRLTCKNWNALSKSRNFAQKHLRQEATSKKFMVVMIMNYRLYLKSINLYDNVESCVEHEAKLISLDTSYEVSKVYHCDGLLLCITKDHTKLVVWNPYWGQTRCIEPTLGFPKLEFYSYAIGYDQSRSYKILVFIDNHNYEIPFVEIKLYDLSSDLWKVLDAAPDGHVHHYDHGVSLKGDTYWFARDKPSQGVNGIFLVCFDFTKERFGPLLSLPFDGYNGNDTVSLSSVREEKLVVLFHKLDSFMLEIWITTEIKPNAVSWSKNVFLEVDTWSLLGDYHFAAESFFIDDEKKVCMVVDIDGPHYVAFIVGVDGYLRKVNLEAVKAYPRGIRQYPNGCSYVPSLVQLN